MEAASIPVTLALSTWEKVLQRLRRGAFETVAAVILRMTMQLEASAAARKALALATYTELEADPTIRIVLNEADWKIVQAHSLISSPVAFRIRLWRNKAREYLNAWMVPDA